MSGISIGEKTSAFTEALKAATTTLNWERAKAVLLEAKANSVTEGLDSKILNAIAWYCKNSDFWAELVTYPAFKTLKNEADEYMKTPLGTAAVCKNMVAAKALLRAGVGLSIRALDAFSTHCKDPELWAMILEHPQFPVLKNEGSPVATPLKSAIMSCNIVAAKVLLDAGVNLDLSALYYFSKKCEDPELWAMILGHPQFHALKNEKNEVPETLLDIATNWKNAVAWTYLKLAGAEGEVFSPPPINSAMAIQYCLNLDLELTAQLFEKRRNQRRDHFAEVLATVFLKDEFAESREVLSRRPEVSRRLWLSLIDNGDLPANEVSLHRPHIPWLANKVRGTEDFEPVLTEAILSQTHHATIKAQAWAFIALYRMNPNDFMRHLKSDDAKEFRKHLSADVVKKISIFAPIEHAKMETEGIFDRGDSDLLKALKLLQESKDPLNIEEYSSAVTDFGNAWIGLEGRFDVLESLVNTLAWAGCLEVTEESELLKKDIWRTLGLLTVGKALSEELEKTQKFEISDTHKCSAALKVVELLNIPDPSSTPFAAAPMGGAGGEAPVAPLSGNLDFVARTLLTALGKRAPEPITTLEQFKALLPEAVDEAKSAGEAKGVLL